EAEQEAADQRTDDPDHDVHQDARAAALDELAGDPAGDRSDDYVANPANACQRRGAGEKLGCRNHVHRRSPACRRPWPAGCWTTLEGIPDVGNGSGSEIGTNVNCFRRSSAFIPPIAGVSSGSGREIRRVNPDSGSVTTTYPGDNGGGQMGMRRHESRPLAGSGTARRFAGPTPSRT